MIYPLEMADFSDILKLETRDYHDKYQKTQRVYII